MPSWHAHAHAGVLHRPAAHLLRACTHATHRLAAHLRQASTSCMQPCAPQNHTQAEALAPPHRPCPQPLPPRPPPPQHPLSCPTSALELFEASHSDSTSEGDAEVAELARILEGEHEGVSTALPKRPGPAPMSNESRGSDPAKVRPAI